MILPGTLSTLDPSPVAIPAEDLWRLTIEQYHAMIDQGILTEDDPLELLEGLLVTKVPKKRTHSFVTQALRDLLARLILAGWFIDVQEPITLGGSEPEPDLTVIRGARRDFVAQHPVAGDVGLAVEVSHTTLARDRGLKKRIYARAGIAVYWIVNLVERQVEVYTGPSGPTEQPDYAQRHDFGVGDLLPIVLDGQQVATIGVEEILGPSTR